MSTAAKTLKAKVDEALQTLDSYKRSLAKANEEARRWNSLIEIQADEVDDLQRALVAVEESDRSET